MLVPLFLHTYQHWVSSVFLLSSLCCFYIYSWTLSRFEHPFVLWIATCIYFGESCLVWSFCHFSVWSSPFSLLDDSSSSWIKQMNPGVGRGWQLDFPVCYLSLGFVCLIGYLKSLYGHIYKSILYTSWFLCHALKEFCYFKKTTFYLYSKAFMDFFIWHK